MFFFSGSDFLQMQSSALVFFSLTIAGLVLVSGCTQGTTPAATTTPLPAAGSDLRALALVPADLPACFSLTSEQVKTPGDVGRLANDLGWQAGYAVTFTCPSADKGEPTVILHSLAVYPAENMPVIAAMVDMQDRSTPGLVYENLTFPGREAEMRGFYGRTGNMEAGNVSAGDYLINGGEAGSGTTSRNDIAEIVISRDTTFEVLRMSGPVTNATLLSDLAKTVLFKIP
jgi:hypothetical protein